MEIFPFKFTVLHLMLFFFKSLAVHDNFTDLSALLAFKAHLSDPTGILSTNWTTNTSFCTWTGVSCSQRRQRVVALDIQNSLLYGTIPPQIGNLSFLSLLNLGNNSLQGTIPDSLLQMPRLKSLTLQYNQLSGSIPPTIFNMSMLTALYLPYNNFSGTLPSNHSLSSIIPRLQILSVSSNQLSGNIPSRLSLFHDLRELSLSENQFSGKIPVELGNLEQLTLLYLSNNFLTGTIPSSLGNLTNMLELDISFNRMNGTIPQELGSLTNLITFFLSNNFGITGHIPLSISNCSNLQVIDFGNNNFTGPVGVEFGNMPYLKTLFLGGNKLNGGLDFLTSLSYCRHLGTLGFWLNELGGSIPNTIGNLSNLMVFAAMGNSITGEIPAEMGNLTSLSVIDLDHNDLVGTIPSEIMMLESLQWLNLGRNRIHGSIPRELNRLRFLNKLILSGNALSGSIPDSFGNISGLQRLLLGANALSSEIPQSIWRLTGLIELNLSQNFLKGSLPPMVGSIQSLDTLDLSKNQLSGNIPTALKEIQLLRYIDLSNNLFDGQIPQSLGELINMEVLNLSCNNLSGVIPNSLANLRHLDSINLSYNKLEGKIPNGGVFLNLTAASLVGNVALCGELRLGLPPCPTSAATSNSGSRARLLKYVLPAIASSIIFLIACFCVLFKFRRMQATNSSPTNLPTNLPSHDYLLISYRELVRATENFSEANILGRGSFGSVYKGCLDDGRVVAIKVLNLEVDGAVRSFDAECGALSVVRHRNLIKIISTCSNLNFRALILQLMPNGSLERWLHSNDYCLSLVQRISIVLDVASALEHLHHHHVQVIVHSDLKPSNVLLDEQMTAHVSDFGIAKVLVGDSWTVTSASTPGTIGYIAPEYGSGGKVSRKGDVYSFGILLLEIFTGKKPTDPLFVGELSLRQWVYEAYPAALSGILDRKLLTDASGNETPEEDLIAMHGYMSSIIELGIICSEDSPKERPEMKEVVQKLQTIYSRGMSIEFSK